jgi:DnaJ family protein A protein 2
MAAFEKGNPRMDPSVDLDDILAQMFGMGGMGGMGGMPGMGSRGGMHEGQPQRKQKGRDVIQQYDVSLEELYKGKTVKLSSTRNKLCTVCEG